MVIRLCASLARTGYCDKRAMEKNPNEFLCGLQQNSWLKLLEFMAVWVEETSELLGCAVRASGLWKRRQDATTSVECNKQAFGMRHQIPENITGAEPVIC